ncbi:MAG TPA: hypothetical protein VF820_05730, partial [Patescibacteria group bacterium]
VKRRSNEKAAWFVLLFSLFLPYNIYYGRTILPDTSMVSTLLGGMFFLDKWLDAIRKKTTPQILFLLASLLFTAGSLLLKPYSLFYGLAMVVLVWTVLGWKFIKRWELWIFALLSVAPLIWWRHFMLSYPEGIPVNNWLFNGNGIRFRPSFFRWMGYERLTKLIGGYVGIIFVALGSLGIWKTKKDKWFFFSFVLSAVIYTCVIATGNVQHDYYQIVSLPAVALLMGFGASWLVMFIGKFTSEKIANVIVIFLILVGFWFSWLQVRDYFNINNPNLIIAGNAVAKLTPKNAKVIAPYDGDTTFLYYTQRQGWPSFEHSLDELRKMGAGYLVLVNPKPEDVGIGNDYKIIGSTSAYLLFDLHKKL